MLASGKGSQAAGGDVSITAGVGADGSGEGGDLKMSAGHALAGNSLGGSLRLAAGKFPEGPSPLPTDATLASVQDAHGGHVALKDSQGVVHLTVGNAKTTVVGRHADDFGTDTKLGFFGTSPSGRQGGSAIVAADSEHLKAVDSISSHGDTADLASSAEALVLNVQARGGLDPIDARVCPWVDGTGAGVVTIGAQGCPGSCEYETVDTTTLGSALSGAKITGTTGTTVTCQTEATQVLEGNMCNSFRPGVVISLLINGMTQSRAVQSIGSCTAEGVCTFEVDASYNAQASWRTDEENAAAASISIDLLSNDAGGQCVQGKNNFNAESSYANHRIGTRCTSADTGYQCGCEQACQGQVAYSQGACTTGTWNNYYEDALNYNWRVFDGEYGVHLCARSLANYGMALPHADGTADSCMKSYGDRTSLTCNGSGGAVSRLTRMADDISKMFSTVNTIGTIVNENQGDIEQLMSILDTNTGHGLLQID
jgi:hypothetical protein